LSELPQFSIVSYSNRLSEESCNSFSIEYEKAVKMLRVLQPPMQEFQFYGNYFEIEKKMERYEELFECSEG
jgi:hypothetical protein